MPRIPLFPLRTVLVPGLVLPLHIFEPRYRLMIQMLASAPEDERGFGVVALRPGARGESPDCMYEIGTVAKLAEITELEDGRFDVVTVGAGRFQIGDLIDVLPFTQADVRMLAEPTGDPQASCSLAELTEQASSLLVAYRRRIAKWGVIDVPEISHLPSDPTALSYLVAAALVVDLAVHQELLACPSTADRLANECSLLRSEIALMSGVPSLPAVDLAGADQHAN